MGRIIGGVVLGYVVMVAAVMVTFTIVYMAMGADRAFKADSYDVTGLWLAASTILSLAAAILGGWVAVRIGKSTRAAVYLAIAVVVIGVVFALPTLNAPRSDDVRTGDIGNTEAMMKAQQPPAVTILNPCHRRDRRHDRLAPAQGVLTGEGGARGLAVSRHRRNHGVGLADGAQVRLQPGTPGVGHRAGGGVDSPQRILSACSRSEPFRSAPRTRCGPGSGRWGRSCSGSSCSENPPSSRASCSWG